MNEITSPSLNDQPDIGPEERRKLEASIELAIELLDQIDGDSDFEDDELEGWNELEADGYSESALIYGIDQSEGPINGKAFTSGNLISNLSDTQRPSEPDRAPVRSEWPLDARKPADPLLRLLKPGLGAFLPIASRPQNSRSAQKPEINALEPHRSNPNREGQMSMDNLKTKAASEHEPDEFELELREIIDVVADYEERATSLLDMARDEAGNNRRLVALIDVVIQQLFTIDDKVEEIKKLVDARRECIPDRQWDAARRRAEI